MANGMVNPFAPMQRAQQGLNNALIQAPQIRGQRLQNQAQQMQTQNALAQQAQDAKAQQYSMPKKLEFYKKVNPAKAQELFKGIVSQTMDLADLDPRSAEQFWQQNTGEQISIVGKQGDYTIIDTDKGKMAVNKKNPSDIQPLQQGGQTLRDGGKLSAKEQEINRYLDLGIVQDRAEAAKLAEGLYKLKEGPFGVELWDLSTGQRIRRSGKPSQGDQQGAEGQTQAQQERRDRPFLTLDEARAGVGPMSGVKQAINNVIGPFTPGQPFEGTERAKNKLAMFSQMIKPHLMVSSRGAIYEQQNIEKMLPSADDFLKDPDSAKTKLQNLYSVVSATIRRKQQLMENEEMTPDQMQEFNQDINNLQTALSYLPDEEMLFGDETRQMSMQLQNMGISEIKQINTKELTPEQRQTLEQRVDELLEQQTQ